MARMLPELNEEQLRQLPSQAEAKFYRTCRDQLDDRHLVLYSVAWVSPSVTGAPCDGEADFVIFHPDNGLIAVEVKGGGVSYDPTRDADWMSIDFRGVQHRIKDPFRQAASEKHSLLALLRKDPSWQKLGCPRILAGHGVFLPDVDDVAPLASALRPKEIIGGRSHMRDFAHWLGGVKRYWSLRSDRLVPLGIDGIRVVEEVFCNPVCVRPLVSVQLQHEEHHRIRLTSQQAMLLRALGDRKRAAVCGGAGTGKTILALQKARQLAESGIATLLLCYNRPLSDYMKDAVQGVPNLHAMTFHQLCDWRVRIVGSKLRRDLLAEAREFYPGEDHFNVHLPFTLGLSTEVLDDRYDAILVDEGQDFGDDFWLPIEMLLRDPESGRLYVFYDQNQGVYRRPQKLPVREYPFVLSVNCRNTREIHDLAYRYYQGEEIAPCEIDGVPVQLITSEGLKSQTKSLVAEVATLISTQKVSASDICVLVAGQAKDLYYDALKRHKLPNGIRWGFEQHRVPSTVLVDTVSRFKGLESGVLFLWGIDKLDLSRDRETIYIGTSRAKSRLILVGSAKACRQIAVDRPQLESFPGQP